MDFDYNTLGQQLSSSIAQQHDEFAETFSSLEEMRIDEVIRQEEARQAAIETAENTAEMKTDLKTVIHNQNSYIKMLEYQNQLLKNMFASGEDGVAVQKEIMKILQEQGESDGTLKDKGLDAIIQSVFLGVQVWLKAKGIDF